MFYKLLYMLSTIDDVLNYYLEDDEPIQEKHVHFMEEVKIIPRPPSVIFTLQEQMELNKKIFAEKKVDDTPDEEIRINKILTKKDILVENIKTEVKDKELLIQAHNMIALKVAESFLQDDMDLTIMNTMEEMMIRDFHLHKNIYSEEKTNIILSNSFVMHSSVIYHSSNDSDDYEFSDCEEDAEMQEMKHILDKIKSN